MGMEVQGRRKRGRPRRRWLAREKHEITEKDCQGRKCMTELQKGVYYLQISTSHKSGIKIRGRS